MLSDSKVVKIFNVPFSCCSFEDILKIMESVIENKSKGYISITNTESLYHAVKLPSHYEYVNNAKFSCCDGIGIVLAGKLLGLDIPRLHGPDLMLKCCQYGVEKKWRHFFYGGKEGIPNLLKIKMEKKYPGMITAGLYSPPFRLLTLDEDVDIIENINSSKPDILWVGLGLIKQEKWIAEHRNKLDVPLIIGVGAAFDFHAGTIKRAPKFYRELGLEWLYRVAFEPRMIHRNILSFKLLLMVMWDVLKNRKSKFFYKGIRLK